MPSEDHFDFASLERTLMNIPSQHAEKQDADEAIKFLQRLDKENGTADGRPHLPDGKYDTKNCICWKCKNVEGRFQTVA